jgi:hypothetical protein
MNVLSNHPGGEKIALTRPRFRVNTSTKWEVNITRKYHVASSAMLSKIVGTLSPGTLDFLAEKIINENARESDVYISSAASALPGPDPRRLRHTVEEGYACICDL